MDQSKYENSDSGSSVEMTYLGHCVGRTSPPRILRLSTALTRLTRLRVQAPVAVSLRRPHFVVVGVREDVAPTGLKPLLDRIRSEKSNGRTGRVLAGGSQLIHGKANVTNESPALVSILPAPPAAMTTY
jgi:hypothetical protein